MALAPQLSAVHNHLHSNPGLTEVTKIIDNTEKEFSASFKHDATIKVGDTFPSFELSDAFGKKVSSADLIANGPILITFYRGEWCPYCNLALAALQKNIDEFKSKGVTLVAISPELPNQSLSTTEKHALKFPVLSDVGNKLAKQLGILFPQPDAFRVVFNTFGQDLKARNGDDSLEVPVPANFLIDQKGVVRNAHIETDWSKRLEPSTALEWASELQK